MDNNDNSQSRFPRSSLRARSRTVMATPADVADYTPRAAGADGRATTSIEDALDLSLSEVADQASTSKLDDALGDDFSTPNKSEHSLTEGLVKPELESARASVLDAIDEVSALAEVEEFVADPEPEAVAPVAKILRPAGSKPQATSIDYNAEQVEVTAPLGAREVDGGDDVLEVATTQGSGRECVVWKKPGKIVGFLVSFASDPLGNHVVLREGRLLISCENGSSDNCLVIAHETVSPMHAIMRVAADGSILILDQLSEHGTRIKRAESGKEESLLGDKSYLKHGDVVIFGECEYHLCVLGGAAMASASLTEGDKERS